MGAVIVEAVAAVRAHAEELDATGVDVRGERRDEPHVLELPFLTAAGRKGEDRNAPMSVHRHTHLAAQSVGIPPRVFFVHEAPVESQGVLPPAGWTLRQLGSAE